MLVWLVVHIWGTGATDTSNDAWVRAKSHTDTKRETRKLRDVELYCNSL